MDELKISKNAQILKYFLKRAEDGIGRTKLVKLTYLADLSARELLGRQVSEFEYIWHHHGPWDNAFFAAMKELEDSRLAVAEDRQIGGYTENRLVDIDGPAVWDLSPAELEILSWVYEQYVDSPLQELLYDVVYETIPMKRVDSKGEKLPMELVDNTVRNTLGYDPEEILAIEEEMDLGHYLPLGAVFDDLHGAAVA